MNITDIKMSYKFIGLINPKNWNHRANSYKVTFKYNRKQFTIDYYMGTGLDESHLTIENVLYSLLTDAQSTVYNFNDFCNEFDYDNDSNTALNIYKTCQSIYKKLHKMFTNEELEYLQNYIDNLDL